jgi:hypothetical protein
MGSKPRRSNRSKKSATSPARAEAAPADEPLIAIRAQNSANRPFKERIVTRSAGQKMVLMARHWGYILRVRTRWAGDSDMREYFGTRAVEDLGKLGIDRDAIQELALAEHIEIELYGWEDENGPAKPDSVFEAVSEIPWEYLLSAATKSVGRFQSLLISRWFSRRSKVAPKAPPKVAPRGPPGAPRQFLFVESAPGRIGDVYGFEDEETRILAATTLEEHDELKEIKQRTGITFSRTEPYSELKSKVEAGAWEAIHVTGVDTHQAAWLISGFYDDEEGASKVARLKDVIDEDDRLHDGMIIRGDQDSELPVRYDELADLLLGKRRSPGASSAIASRKPPHVVTLNLYYSGARTARELVRRGVYAALGFLDEINDEFAEHFFQAFYWAWCHDKKKTIPESFLEAWGTMDHDRMHGTAIVIWLGRSAFDSTATAPARTIAKPAAKKRTGAR